MISVSSFAFFCPLTLHMYALKIRVQFSHIVEHRYSQQYFLPKGFALLRNSFCYLFLEPTYHFPDLFSIPKLMKIFTGKSGMFWQSLSHNFAILFLTMGIELIHPFQKLFHNFTFHLPSPCIKKELPTRILV